jgi:Uma2 family endonuclease
MTVAVPPPGSPSSQPRPTYAPPALDGIVLEGVSWETYERLRDELDDCGQHVYITYDQGRMVLMSPRPEHERWKRFIGRLVEALSFERRIPIAPLGNTTWCRKDVRRGLEADECYYVQHENNVRGKLDINLRRDPPPDLAIEIELTHHPVDREGVYAALGVPEVWHYDGQRLTCHLLGAAGKYDAAEYSAAFPFLRPSELERFVAMLPATDENSIIAAFLEWVRAQPRPK